MGIIIDVVLIGVVLFSAYLGYKAGFVKLGAGLISGVLAIILTLVIFKPMAQLLIDKTNLDERIQAAIVQNTGEVIEKNIPDENLVTNKISNDILPSKSEEMSKSLVYALSGIIIFVFSKVIIKVGIVVLDVVIKIPVLRQFNEIGGAIYGIVRGVIGVCLIVLLMGVYINIRPESNLNQTLDDSFMTKIIYKNIVKF